MADAFPEIEMTNWRQVDYEGQPMLVCKRCRGDVATFFDGHSASVHDGWHAEQDAAASQREALTATQTPDYGPDPEPPKPKRQTKAKVKDD